MLLQNIKNTYKQTHSNPIYAFVKHNIPSNDCKNAINISDETQPIENKLNCFVLFLQSKQSTNGVFDIKFKQNVPL